MSPSLPVAVLSLAGILFLSSQADAARLCGFALIRHVRMQCSTAICEVGQRATTPDVSQLADFARECCAHSCPYDMIRSLCCEAADEGDSVMRKEEEMPHERSESDYEQLSNSIHHHHKHHKHHRKSSQPV